MRTLFQILWTFSFLLFLSVIVSFYILLSLNLSQVLCIHLATKIYDHQEKRIQGEGALEELPPHSNNVCQMHPQFFLIRREKVRNIL